MTGHVLAIDQGTTSSRAIVFDGDMKVVASAQKEFTQHYPGIRLGRARSRGNLGIASSATCRDGAEEGQARAPPTSPAIGITNQRETVVIWDTSDRQADPQRHRLAGPPHRRRSAQKLKRQGLEPKFTQKTGLLLDPYFSGTKIAWLLDNVKGARAARRARRAAVRHRRQLPDLAADRRQGACHRCDQRLAHAALQHRDERAGTTSC